MFFRLALRPFVVCSAILVATQLASAQQKVAIVNLQKALFDTAEITKASADMNATLQPRQAAAQKLQTEIRPLRRSCRPMRPS